MIEPVIYRNESAPPTKPGWYYAQAKGNTRKPAGTSIIPRLVERSYIDGDKLIMGSSTLSIDHYRWFGPVTPVKEG